MTDHMNAAIEGGAKAWWEARTTLNPENDKWDNADRFPEEKEYALKNAQLNIQAALPHLRAMIAEEIMAYLDDFPSHGLIYRDGVWAGVHSATRIAKGDTRE